MASEPEYSDWQQLMSLVKEASEQDQQQMLLTMMMTPDERDALVARVNIFCESVSEFATLDTRLFFVSQYAANEQTMLDRC